MRGESVGQTERILADLGKGPRLDPSAAAALQRLLGREVGRDGLSRLFQPSFPGVRTFSIQVRAAPDQALELTLVGIARDGRPVWIGQRAFVQGRDGSLEIHRGFDEVDAAYQSRNITTDLMRREMQLLERLGTGPSSRLTIDAEGVGRYVCAMHGFRFADESDEGPPLRSVRAFEPDGDRSRLQEAGLRLADRVAQRYGIGRLAVEATMEEIREASEPWQFARVKLAGMPKLMAEGDDGDLGVGAFGRQMLLSTETPAWRACLPLNARVRKDDPGEEYRRRKTARSEARLFRELAQCRRDLDSGTRPTKIRSIQRMGLIAPSWFLPELKAMTHDPDRRVASVAKQAVRQIQGTDLQDRLLRFGLDSRNEPRRRGLALRVLAEHFPARLKGLLPMLRVHPDARIQRSIVPLLERSEDPGAELASMLAANPRDETEDGPRPGVEAMRIELIERLTELRDPSTLPVLMAAYRRSPPPPPAEQLALSRALVVFPDPRAQTVLAEPRQTALMPPLP
jgi:hypothetical protein